MTMNYRKMFFKPSYESRIDNLVEDFYIPTLQQAVRYDRITGFFSSTSLALSARGIVGLIKNGGSMRMITCPRLEPRDINIIEQSMAEADIVIETSLAKSFVDLEDDFQRNHVAALGWLLSKGILEIKIALIYENGKLLNEKEIQSSSIMHQKVGIMYDEEWNGISFSGSNNESASGWLNNVEEFKVFSSWEVGQKPYYDSDRLKFERMWSGKYPAVEVRTLPQAIAEKLIEQSNTFSIEQISLEKYRQYLKSSNYSVDKKSKGVLKLFSYQEEAVNQWFNTGKKMLLEMATGCGKTRTAIGCIKKLLEMNQRPLLIVIACPGNTLSMQWKADIDSLEISLDKSIICDGTNSKWRIDLEKLLHQLSTGYYHNGIVYTSHQTCSSQDFLGLITQNPKIEVFFIGDEVHGMGADKAKNGLLEFYLYRLGLSATPSRWFDESGTKLIENYFGNNAFIFTIHDALTTINPLTGKPFLVNYYYHPHFVHLTDEELGKYKRLSDKIIKMSGSKDEDKKKIMEYLLFQRADIEKAAENKYRELSSVLDEIGDDISDTIIFVSPEQIDRVLEMLAQRRTPILAHSFTEKESSVPSEKYCGLSERQYLIEQFKDKRYQVLVAIKCLDEGIDIPSAKRAIVMASSTNPREYVQRIGRVIRQDSNKKNAEIYDLIIKPDLDNGFSEQFRSMERKIFLKEMDRVMDLSENAINNVDVYNSMCKIKGEMRK